tara:strand:+ start:1331 stop:1609 length:279 start_codon:yes stop_codon:yes gene_type:complete
MSEQSIEQFLFNHKIYQEAQANFLQKGLEGSAQEMLREISSSFKLYTSDHEDIRDFFMQKIAQKLLLDLKEGLMNNDLAEADVAKLTNGGIK